MIQNTKLKWTRDEMLIAFNLYCKIPFGQIHNKNPKIIQLAAKLNRTPSSVSWKLANLARFDESLKMRNIKGASHGSRLEKEIWDEYYKDPEQIIYESEKLLFEYNLFIDVENKDTVYIKKHLLGHDVTRNVKCRVNQNFFRSMVLATYENRCWISGICNSKLLIAGHIIPWSVNAKERLNPSNGICLNALFDKAFDTGLITITPDYVVVISECLLKNNCKGYFSQFNHMQLKAPRRFLPNKEFLSYHNKKIFNSI